MILFVIKEIVVLFGKIDEIDIEFDIFYRYKVYVVKLVEDLFKIGLLYYIISFI